MIPLAIGILSGFFVIFIILLLKQPDRQIIYGLILSGIGFLYVGFTWSETETLIINCAQAVFFLFAAWYGIRKGLHILATGYFLHASWDLVYDQFLHSNFIPPHYDLFCFSIDFTIGLYLLMIHYRIAGAVSGKMGNK